MTELSLQVPIFHDSSKNTCLGIYLLLETLGHFVLVPLLAMDRVMERLVLAL